MLLPLFNRTTATNCAIGNEASLTVPFITELRSLTTSSNVDFTILSTRHSGRNMISFHGRKPPSDGSWALCRARNNP